MTAHRAISVEPASACRETRLAVPGIHCAGCIGKIERGLATVPGIARARVNFSSRRVTITHAPEIDADALVGALSAIGFEAQPLAPDLLARDDSETRKLLLALAVAGFGMMNIMLLSVSVWSGATGATRTLFHWISAMIAIPVIAFAGRPFFTSALAALRRGRTNMDVPISIGVLLATGLSLYETATGGAHAYFDGATMLLFFLLAGRALDSAMRDRARSGIGALLGRMGQGARVVGADGVAHWVEAAKLEPGMVMLVPVGSALAADGVITEGRTQLDNSLLTGESEPRSAQTGDPIHAGTINLGAPIRVTVSAAGADTSLAEIARLMEEAGQSRSTYVRIADRAARIYAPTVHSLAFLSFVGWMLAGAGLHQSLLIAISVLIITCPCALGLAVPAAQVVASGALMQRGLLIKDGSALERLAEVDEVMFDKTGTLTLGEGRPVDITALSASDRALALALAQTSTHPLSRGLATALRDAGAVPAAIDGALETPGYGVEAQAAGAPIGLVRPDDAPGTAVEFVHGAARQRIAFVDPLRRDAALTIARLDAMGLPSAILSGDRAEPVAAAAATLGISAIGELHPAEKLATLGRLADEGHRVLMVGDGLNDGPALAAAHVSIAPGNGSDVSRQAADAVFVGSALMPVALAVKVARATMRVVRQNFAFAVGYNLLAVPLAVCGYVTPLVAAAAMSTSSLVVVANSLRLAGSAK
jgi:Cu2+-exporting ATPase